MEVTMTFDFSQSKISRLHKKLSVLNPNDPKQYPEYKKLMTELIKIEDNNEIYLRKISTNVNIYTTHMAKIYYHWLTSQSHGLNNPKWTRSHWLEEIAHLFSFTSHYDFNNPRTELNLNIDRISNNYKILIDRVLHPNNMVLSKQTDIIDKLTKGDKDDVHELPPISMNELSLKWDNFLVFYNVFTAKILNKITHFRSDLNPDKMEKFLNRINENTYNTYYEMYQGTEDIKFSELTRDDIIEFIKEY